MRPCTEYSHRFKGLQGCLESPRCVKFSLEFNRVWARLVVQQREREVRLALCSKGNEVEVGRYLDSGGRQRLAQELKSRLNAR